jgi:hypothetical protein
MADDLDGDAGDVGGDLMGRPSGARADRLRRAALMVVRNASASALRSICMLRSPYFARSGPVRNGRPDEHLRRTT